MDRSYIYTKKFIDDEVKKLNKPLVISDNIRNLLKSQNYDDSESQVLTEAQLAKILTKLNTKIKRHNKTYFSAQRKNQIIQQILKAEQNKLLIVNEQMMKIKVILKPILIPNPDAISHEADYIKELEELVNELPESKYLFAKEEFVEEDLESPSEASEEDEEEETGVLIEDTEDRIEKPLSKSQRRHQFKQEIINKLNFNTSNTESRLLVLQKYETLRLDLIQLTRDIRYRMEKLDYLHRLKGDLDRSIGKRVENIQPNHEVYDSDEDSIIPQTDESNVDVTNLQAEMVKFNSLIKQISEKLAYKESDNNIMNIISDINSV